MVFRTSWLVMGFEPQENARHPEKETTGVPSFGEGADVLKALHDIYMLQDSKGYDLFSNSRDAILSASARMRSQNTLGRDFKHKMTISRLFLAIQSAV
ncbi:hypothetical protein SLEP1_g36610 [Rubroshorea leprosula]|uniref:Uncharacterized protein n=1 Tax=Rubroshorea leprosula TaxID=152421 RepID=A0AAV5KS95_9ROSI|nr:hypothetical protein SLEP1_g36610 [Rubroshorea leprosula]